MSSVFAALSLWFEHSFFWRRWSLSGFSGCEFSGIVSFGAELFFVLGGVRFVVFFLWIVSRTLQLVSCVHEHQKIRVTDEKIANKPHGMKIESTDHHFAATSGSPCLTLCRVQGFCGEGGEG